MQVSRQTCQQCGSIEVRNILVREPGQPTVVFVRCVGCRELVAWYQLSGYYHHGKGIESYLKAHGHASGDSARAWLKEFNETKNQALEGYEAALKELADADKEV